MLLLFIYSAPPYIKAGIIRYQRITPSQPHPHGIWLNFALYQVYQTLTKELSYLALRVLHTLIPLADGWYLPQPPTTALPPVCPQTCPAPSYHWAFTHTFPPPCNAGPALPLSNSYPSLISPLKPHLP